MIGFESIDDIAVAKLERGRGNALDVEFLEALQDALDTLRAESPRGVILTAEGKIFCAGLDLVALVEMDEGELESLLDALYATLRAVFAFPRPVVAAINGHAMAGGALLTLACDQRVMAMGEGRWGLTEAQLGLVVPASMIEMSRYALERGVLERLVYGGQAYPGFKAREMGILDDLVDAEDLLDRAAEIIRGWTPVPAAFGDIKARLRAPALAAMEAARPLDRGFLTRWADPEVQGLVRAAVDRLTGSE
jgi:enoyl-CoA hydratase